MATYSVAVFWRHTPRMSTGQSGARSFLATIVGYVIAAIVAVYLLHFVVGTILWLFRTVLIVAVLFGLLLVYMRLKSSD
jgi:Flp pilus assembly protein TadB